MDLRRLWEREDLRTAREHVRNRGMPKMQGDEIPNLLAMMKTVTIEASIPVGARLTPEDILRVLLTLGADARITECGKPGPDPAQTAFQWESRRWQCAGCLHVLTFAVPVTVDDVDSCPRCRGREFRFA